MASNIAAAVPLPPTPLVDASGNISRPWLYFLMALFNRTGGNQGVSLTALQQDIATLQQQAGALFVEDAMSDVAFPPPSVAPAAMFDLMADDVPRAPLNPFLAAMMVS